ncbi:hypothetical protein H6F67_19070 [Microcoleus sp. FACHB-1515]|uniref:hypothetical protein n=1 Tax=Cyanophyceae TaxID=3028117 RepID=UPI00168376CF|nr:hypothetical protein [Microcoleus sp. FACHB-1515]MBD2091951.1 hypothetical protein [Microcoleus sp. FACHB-1515]
MLSAEAAAPNDTTGIPHHHYRSIPNRELLKVNGFLTEAVGVDRNSIANCHPKVALRFEARVLKLRWS